MLDKIRKITDVLKLNCSFWFPVFYEYCTITPSFAAINITDRCCFRCIMCSQWKETNEGELDTDEWKKVLNQLKKVGVKDVVFSGGEPLLRKDIALLAEHNKKIGLASAVITNGYLLNEERLKKLIESGVKNVSVSLDGQGEEFDRIRGIPGAYEKVINACRLISKYKKSGKIKGYLYFTLMKSTVRNYTFVMNISRELNLPLVVNLFDYTPYFFKTLREEKDKFWLNTPEDFKWLKEFQKMLIQDKKITYHTYTEIDYFRRYFKDSLQKNIPCVVSQKRIGIDSRGNVYGGCWSMGSFGNVKEISLKDIVMSKKYKKAHRNMFFKNCPGCSCGYSVNLRYYLPDIVKKGLFDIFPWSRNTIYE